MQSPEEKCKLTGITQEEVFSLGIANLNLKIGNNPYTQRFQLVDGKFPIETDGKENVVKIPMNTKPLHALSLDQ